MCLNVKFQCWGHPTHWHARDWCLFLQQPVWILFFVYMNAKQANSVLFWFELSQTAAVWWLQTHIHLHVRTTAVCPCFPLCCLHGTPGHTVQPSRIYFYTFRRWLARESQALVTGAMWVEMDGGREEEGQEMRGSWSLGTSLHAPPLTHLSLRCRGGWGRRGGMGSGRVWWGRRVSWWTYDSQRRAVRVCAWMCVVVVWWWGCTPSGRWTHMWELELYNIITSCVAPENHKPVSCRVKWLDGLINGPQQPQVQGFTPNLLFFPQRALQLYCCSSQCASTSSTVWTYCLNIRPAYCSMLDGTLNPCASERDKASIRDRRDLIPERPRQKQARTPDPNQNLSEFRSSHLSSFKSSFLHNQHWFKSPPDSYKTCSTCCSTHRPQPVGSQPPTRSRSAIHSGLDSYTASFPASMVAASLEEPPVMWTSMTHREPLLRSSTITTTATSTSTTGGLADNPQHAHYHIYALQQSSNQVHTHSSITYAHMII